MSDASVRIAMWSGPRNISTALMRSWEARGDTAVVDEPFYAYYLRETGREHPGRDAVIAAEPADWRVVAERLAWDPIPGGETIFYQKHMAHHLLRGMEGAWMDRLRHAFLIRDPAEMLSSLVRVTPDPGLLDTGLPQQVRLFRRLTRQGRPPAVIDARDVLEDPPGVLAALCAALGVPWTDRMLTWPPGRRDTDGVWAEHWYAAVERSTGFEPYRPKAEPLPERLVELLAECEPLYRELHAHRLTGGNV